MQESVFLQGTNRFAFESVLFVAMGIIQHKKGISQWNYRLLQVTQVSQGSQVAQVAKGTKGSKGSEGSQGSSNVPLAKAVISTDGICA